MRNTKLVDMFGLSGDPSNDARLDDLLLRFESETPDARQENSKRTPLSSFIAISISNSESGDVLFNQ